MVCREIKEDKINESIVTAHLEDFVSTLPFGVDSMVGDRGVQLSGGQKQRIGIARAIYNNPKVLIMDEATSALDGITEMNISKAISDVSGTMTIIMIAHRLNTVKDCDVIYFMDHGKIVDHGTYEELVKTNPDFRLLSERS